MRQSWFVMTVLFGALGGMLHAQPQAPIEWGEARWLRLSGWPDCPSLGPKDVVPLGDTLLFLAGDLNSMDTSWTAYSFDHGQTVSPWQSLSIPEYPDFYVRAAGSTGRYYLFIESYGSTPTNYVVISSDAGQSWSSLLFPGTGWRNFGFAVGAYVFRLFFSAEERHFRRSSDGGLTWPMSYDYQSIRIESMYVSNIMACTRSNLLILDQAPNGPDSLACQLFLTIGTNWGQEMLPTAVLPNQPEGRCSMGTVICGDTASETAGVLSTLTGPGGIPREPFFQRTTDGGFTWSPCLSMSDGQPIIPPSDMMHPALFCAGKLWMMAWVQYREPEYPGRWVGTRLSANHGRTWYPIQAVTDSADMVYWMRGQFKGNDVRIYWQQLTPGFAHDFRMVSGVLTPDTLRPVVRAAELPPDTVEVGHNIRFLVRVEENDTLGGVRLRIRSDQDSCWTLAMTAATSDTFWANWQVPAESFYRYRIEAEDFWENVGSYPDTGWASFVTEHWSDANGPFIVHPSSFILSVFPNPCNGPPIVTLSAGWFESGAVELTVFNVLGQVVWQGTTRAQTTRLDLRNIPSAGLYFLEVSGRDHHHLSKLFIVK
jgi:hypothetical protein